MSLPIRSDDLEFIDCLLEHNADFRRLMEERRREADVGKTSSLEELRKRLGLADGLQ